MSYLEGIDTWVSLLEDRWPEEWKEKGIKNPVAPLVMSLYGHPDSGGYWERHCDKHLRSVGFQPVSEVWASCYWHQKLELYLVVYVDDFKLAGKAGNIEAGWELIRKG